MTPRNSIEPPITAESYLPTPPEVAKDVSSLAEGVQIVAVAKVSREKDEKMANHESTKDEPDSPREPKSVKEQLLALLAQQPSSDEDTDVEHELYRMSNSRRNHKRLLKKGPRRAKQAAIYTAIVEERLAEVEYQLSRLTGKPELIKLEEDKKPEYPEHELGIVHLNAREFYEPRIADPNRDRKHHVPELSLEPMDIIEVLTEDRRRLQRVKTFDGAQGHGSMGLTGLTDKESGQLDSTRVSCVPDRIRIRSALLLKTLDKITNFEIAGRSPFKHKAVIRRPYKVFVEYQKEISDFHETLKKKHAIDANGNPEKPGMTTNDPAAALPSAQINGELPARSTPAKSRIPSNTTKKDGMEDWYEALDVESFETYRQLGLIIKFMNEDLAPLFDLRRNFEKGELREIYFGDLWAIFRPGVDIKVPGLLDEDLQVYRIVKATGGRDLMSPRLDPPENYQPNDPDQDRKDRTTGCFVIECYSLNFDRGQYGVVHHDFIIRRFEGKRKISSLPAYPLRCDPEESHIREDLMKRGELFARYVTSRERSHLQYDGLTADDDPEQIDSQVIVDYDQAMLANKEWKADLGFNTFAEADNRETRIPDLEMMQCSNLQEGCCGNDYYFVDSVVDDRLHENFMDDHRHRLERFDAFGQQRDDMVLLPAKLPGFILRTRRWAMLNISEKYLNPVTYNPDGWRDLVLPRSYKDEIMALVSHHARGLNKQRQKSTGAIAMDLVRGKGTGIIILLHGEPGVGKTSTAECIADREKRPLYPIVCGDLGGSAREVEDNLEKHFQRAHRWGCVLLLDEADVFLQERQLIDLQQNSIVSVFLRCLEYYAGILFLTTNRPGAIDPAFISRIHLALRYKRLSEEATLTLWTNLLELRFKEEYSNANTNSDNGNKRSEASADAQTPPWEVDRTEILEYAKKHYRDLDGKNQGVWNGRQIRNAFQTAVALAEFRRGGPTQPLILRRENFEEVAKVSEEFDRYLLQVHKVSLAKKAEQALLRVDLERDGDIIKGRTFK